MNDAEMLAKVKNALGIQGEYQDDTLIEYIDAVIDYLVDAGVAESNITAGLVARGVSDLWTYGSGAGKYGAANGAFSEFFVQRAIQLSYKKVN